MKTIYDIFNLIMEETRMNEDKDQKYLFEIDTKHMWVSMYSQSVILKECGDENAERNIFQHQSMSSEHEIQLAYWMIYNNGRSRHQNKGNNGKTKS